jgi:preprotein translocase subunit SecE
VSKLEAQLKALEEELGAAQGECGAMQDWYSTGVAPAAVGLGVASQTAHGAAFIELARSARSEIRKVVWPTRQEATQTTLVVVAVVLVMSLLLWGLDTFLGWLASKLIG